MNPIKAIIEWKRILNNNGYILIVVPNKDYIFDHQRQLTEFSHLLKDYKRNVGEDDLTHLEEIMKHHDLSMDIAAGSFEDFKKRSNENLKFRALHHHVFDVAVLKEIFFYLNIKVIFAISDKNHVILGMKE